MKIIFLLATRNFGGAQRSTLEIATRLSFKHHVEIIEIEGIDENYKEVLEKSGLKNTIYSSSTLRRSPIQKIIQWFLWRKWLKQIINKIDPDYIIVKDVKTLSLLGRNKTYNVFYHARAWYASYQISYKRRLFFKILKPKFIAVSQATRHAIFNAGLANLKDISVVPNSINFPNLVNTNIKANSNQLRILHAGGFIKSKGQYVSLEIAKKLKTLGIDFKMTFAGFVYKTKSSQSYLEALKSKAREYNLSDNVKFVENKKNLVNLLEENNFLIHPSETEGLPRVVIEAMMYQLIVIANPVGGIIDLINNHVTGYITDFNSVDDYVEYLLLAYNNRQLAEEIALRAKELISKGYSEKQQFHSFTKALKL